MMHPPSDTAALRRALGAFATGVTIVTTCEKGGDDEVASPVGFTANSFTSVSLTPPILLVCLAHTAASYELFCASDTFAVNVLAADQQETAKVFATRGADKFADVAWHAGERGAPLIDGSLARFDCAIHERVTAGDHDILLGRVLAFSRHEGPALVYHAGSFARLG
ncbi:MAG: flavin reductase family protein [Pseudomonadota bacterium]